MEDKKQDSIALWKNQKRRNDRDPAYTGRGTVGGKNVQAAAWINTEKKNENSPDFTVHTLRILLLVQREVPAVTTSPCLLSLT